MVQDVSPSFLVRKSNGKDYRLVTAFTSLGEFIKPLPSLMPTVETTLRTISEWKYLISSDLRDAFYQIPLHKGVNGVVCYSNPIPRSTRLLCGVARAPWIVRMVGGTIVTTFRHPSTKRVGSEGRR